MKGRDIGLESILSKYLSRVDTIVRTLRLRAHEIASHIGTQHHGAHFAKMNRESFERRLTPWFHMAVYQTVSLVMSLRRTTYMLSYVGQAEGVGRALGSKTTCNLSHNALMEVLKREMPSGGQLMARLELSYQRLLRDVVDAFQHSQVLESDIHETLARIDRAFPTKRALPKRMARLTEAAKRREPLDGDEQDLESPVIGVDIGDGLTHFPTEQEWNEAVEDYLADEVPSGRGPYDQIFAEGDDGEDLSRYQWEVENEVTNDFVESVRNGEVDAANENGITDFVWISILDSRTCDDCCVPRDGMLTSEIKAALKSGKLDASACDATVPPAHLNCRCRISPATDDLPEKTPPDFGSWDQWLEDKGKSL